MAGRIKRLLPIVASAALLVAAPQAAALPAAGTTPAGEVVIYDTAAPGNILERHAITGLQAGETIEALDVRPATGQLYALGYLEASTGVALYVIDPGTGVATRIGPAEITSGLSRSFGMDFNPQTGRIRVVETQDVNLRLHPDTGTPAEFDMSLADGTGPEQVAAIAHDQNDHGTGQTTLWGYDFIDNHLARIGGPNGGGPEGSPNNGVVVPFGPATGAIAGIGRGLGMDITPGGEALLTLTTAGPTTHGLYRANLATGAVTSIGQFPEDVRDVAVLQSSLIALDGPTTVVEEAASSATITLRRTGSATGTQTVQYATSDGTATAEDYTPATGTVTFAPGETTKTFAVPIAGDAADEPWETVNVSLSTTGGGAVLGLPVTGTLTIVDDDAPAPPADDAKPQLLVSVPATRRRAQVNKGVRGKIAASEACAVRLRLKLGKRTIGTRALAPAGPGVTDFAVRPGKRGRRALRKRLRSSRTAVVRVQARGTDAAGNAGAASARLTVRR